MSRTLSGSAGICTKPGSSSRRPVRSWGRSGGRPRTTTWCWTRWYAAFVGSAGRTRRRCTLPLDRVTASPGPPGCRRSSSSTSAGTRWPRTAARWWGEWGWIGVLSRSPMCCPIRTMGGTTPSGSAAFARSSVPRCCSTRRSSGCCRCGEQTLNRSTTGQTTLLTTFAAQAAIAITDVELVRVLETETRTAELGRKVDQLQALGAVIEAVNSSLDLDEVLSMIVEHAVRLSGTDGGSIMEFDDHRQEFAVRATYGATR